MLKAPLIGHISLQAHLAYDRHPRDCIPESSKDDGVNMRRAMHGLRCGECYSVMSCAMAWRS